MVRTASAGSRAGRRLVIAVLVVLVVLLVLDRAGDYVAERIAADTLQSSEHLTDRPKVSIGGFPFLTQLATNKYDEVTISASRVPVGARGVTFDLAGLVADLHHITASRNFSTLHAKSVTADARLSYTQLSHVLGFTVRYAGANRIKATKSITVLGTTISASISTQPALVNGGLGFVRTIINGVGQVSAEAATLLNKVFNLSIPLQNIPFHIRVTALQAQASGLHVIMTGSNLTYRS